RREVIKKHTQKDAGGEAAAPRVRKVKAAPGAEDGEEDDAADLPLNVPPAVRAAAPALPPSQKPLPFTPPAAGEQSDEGPDTRTPPPAATRAQFPLPPSSILDEIKSDATMDRSRLFERAKILQQKSQEFG